MLLGDGLGSVESQPDAREVLGRRARWPGEDGDRRRAVGQRRLDDGSQARAPWWERWRCARRTAQDARRESGLQEVEGAASGGEADVQNSRGRASNRHASPILVRNTRTQTMKVYTLREPW